MPDQDPPRLRHLERATRYTIADLAERASCKRRTIQLWAEGGVLISAAEVHPGTGNARLFSVVELQLAALLTPLARMGVPIGVLTRFSSVIRPALYLPHFGPVTVTGRVWPAWLAEKQKWVEAGCPPGRGPVLHSDPETGYRIERRDGQPDLLHLQEDVVIQIGQVLERAMCGHGCNWLLLAHSPDEIRIGVQTDEDGPFDPDELRRMDPPLDARDSATVILDLEILSKLEV